MICCCKKTYNFCTPVKACDPVELLSLFSGLPAGSYRLRYEFNGVSNYADLVKTEDGAELTGASLNEFFTYTGQVYNASTMEPMKLTVASVEYDCFYFKTTP